MEKPATSDEAAMYFVATVLVVCILALMAWLWGWQRHQETQAKLDAICNATPECVVEE